MLSTDPGVVSSVLLLVGSTVGMLLNRDQLASLIDTFTDPDGVRLDPAVALVSFRASELRTFAALLLADADLLDAADGSSSGGWV